MKRVSPTCCAISAGFGGVGGTQSQLLNRYDGAAASLSFLHLSEKGMMDKQALVCLISFCVAYLAVLSTSDAGSVAILAF